MNDTATPVIESNLLLLYAHPDDAEIWSGGTLLKYAALNRRITLIIATGNPQRRREAEASAAAVRNLSLIFLDGRTEDDFAQTKFAEIVARKIEQERPATIITHGHDDLHKDHQTCFRLLQLSLFHLPRDMTVPKIFECNSYSGLTGNGNLFQPTTFVDITAEANRKEELIRFHSSQRCEVYIDMCKRMEQFYGLIAGVQRAEAFRRLVIRNSSTYHENII